MRLERMINTEGLAVGETLSTWDRGEGKATPRILLGDRIRRGQRPQDVFQHVPHPPKVVNHVVRDIPWRATVTQAGPNQLKYKWYS
jgi:hypothetical protein